MKLKSVRVKMFCNILDSTEVAIQPDVTCLVGKNESGKTAFLQSLWRLNPARLKPEFSVPDNYPAWLEKKHRIAGQDLNKVKPVEAIFAWETADEKIIEEKFGPHVASKDLLLAMRYENKYVWTHGCNERKAVDNFIREQKLARKYGSQLKGSNSFEELDAKISEELQDNGDEEKTAVFQKLKESLNNFMGEDDFTGALWKLLKPRIPRFFYFADYSKLPYTVTIDRVLKNPKDLTESEATARSLLNLGGAENEYINNPDYERRVRELENVSNALTDDVLKYWSQNNELRVKPEITQRTEKRPDGQHSVLDELKIRIWDNRHSLTLPFDQHSAGFQWFFSFLAAFSEYEYQNPPVVILLDEPAVGLHAKAQADFLRFIEERLTKRCQVIYTTHSPFMIQPGHLERVRVVEDRGREEGSIVSSDVLTRDPDTLFPLQGALGYDLVQHLFVAEHNLVVEGTSDYTYIKLISDYLASKKDKISLDSRWSIVPVGGADAVPTFVALLGNHLNVTVLVDSRKEGHQKLNRFTKDGFLAKNRIIMVGDILDQKAGDIEDLFTVKEYLNLYNRAFDASLEESDLNGTDPIVARIARHLGIERYDHGVPADVFLRERDSLIPKLSEDTLKRFENLFMRINKTI